MGEKTGIAWTDSTFNPWIGCTMVSPACANCYAEQSKPTKQHGVRWGPGQPRHRTGPETWRKPLRWNREAEASGVRRKVFCLSLGDWLDPEIPVEWLSDLLELIGETPWLDWQLLTKRPECWKERMEAVVAHGDSKTSRWADKPAAVAAGTWLSGIRIPPNVWVGCTVEDQQRANERIPLLLRIPALVRFLSMEPLLEGINLFQASRPGDGTYIAEFSARNTALGDLNWVIVGGESGDKARPFNLGWARDIMRQCEAAGVAVFIKQMGDLPINPLSMSAGGEGLRLPAYKAHNGADPAEWPEDLRVRQFPTV